MKRLFLLRHAKSDWSTETRRDHDRPLSERGQRAAGLVGGFVKSLDQVPDRVVSSSAVRAATTAQIACKSGEWDLEVVLTSDLYEAEPARLLAFLQGVPDEIDSIMLVGHEPVWSATAGALIGQGRLKMVTAALARIDLAVEQWRDLEFGAGTLAWLVTPKVLEAAAGKG